MGRGVSSGGGQSSLGYLFGDVEAPMPTNSGRAPPKPAPIVSEIHQKPTVVAAPAEAPKQVPAGIFNKLNSHHRANGPNNGNFITDRPSTKVHAAPGGGSSLGYLFGGGGN